MLYMLQKYSSEINEDQFDEVLKSTNLALGSNPESFDKMRE